MRTRLMIALVAATALAPTALFAQGSTVGGAVGGAVVGGVVAGPPGAVVGAAIGGTVGMAAEPPGEVVTYVQRERSPSVRYERQVVVGEPLDQTVELRAVPSHTEYRYAVVNDRRVVVDAKTRKIVKIVE
jgi:hypothetical protein